VEGPRRVELPVHLCVCRPGLDLWKRNLQLLVPFLVQPKIALYSTDIRQSSSPSEVEVGLIVWRLVSPPQFDVTWGIMA
jgi:hypothetical protein